MQAKHGGYIKYVILFLIVFVPLFVHLEKLPIRIWDEARLAVSAYEMLQNKDFIVTYFDGSPDMWSTKPPLMIWAQAFCMSIFGVNELAVRLPSAIATLLTCFVLLRFCTRELKNFWMGFIAVVILVSSFGYISIHGTRTGDYDALVTLFTTLSGLSFYTYCQHPKNRTLYLFFLYTALAVLTKSTTGLLFIPAIALYALSQKQVLPLIKNKHFYFGLLGFLVLVVGYYLWREAKNPGYLAAVEYNEWGGRYLEALSNQTQPFWFYYDNFVHEKFTPWYLLVPCAIVVGLVIKDQALKRLTLFSALMLICFFLVISSAQTNLHWYDLPMYPFLALLTAIFVGFVFDWLKNVQWVNTRLSVNVLPYLMLFLLSVTPYSKVVSKLFNPQENPWDLNIYHLTYYLKGALEGKHDLDGHRLIFGAYNGHNLFYIYALREKGVDIDMKSWDVIEPNETVIAYEDHIKNAIQEHYTYEVVHLQGNVVTYKILGKKD